MPWSLLQMNLRHRIRKLAQGKSYNPLKNIRPLIFSKACGEQYRLKLFRSLYESEFCEYDQPLVSVVMTTYSRGELVLNRTAPCVLNQTYQNIEWIIVGDHTAPEHAEAINKIDDPRVCFINLHERGKYPENKKLCRLVAGTKPANYSNMTARGKWIAHMTDDISWEPDHIEKSLENVYANNLELSWAKMSNEVSTDKWEDAGSDQFSDFVMPHSTLLLRFYLKEFLYDPQCYKYGLGGDRSLFRRMYFAGVRGGMSDHLAAKAALRPGTTKMGHRAEDR